MRTILPILLLFLLSCVTNPYTGRSQLLLIDQGSEMQLGAQNYQEMLGKQKLSRDPAEVDPVRRAGKRIAAAAARHPAAKAPDFKWEFNVIVDDETVNAWCLPGGKVAVYTGLFPAVHDEAGLAFVMGHEVSHALLRHGAERISQNMASGAVGGLLAAGLGGKDEKSQEMVLSAYGAAVNVGVLLPFSRSHESEADRLGLELMAMAGYDPKASVEVWKRMSEMSSSKTPEFLSTHPSHETRIHDLEALMPKAKPLYDKSEHATVEVLPKVGGRKGHGGQGGDALAPTANDVSASATSRQRSVLKDGRKALLFEFSFDHDVYIENLQVTGPGALKIALDANTGIPSHARKYVTIYRPEKEDPDFPSGRYVLSFQGRTSGHKFTTACSYSIP